MATRSAATSVSNWRSSSFCTRLSLLFLATDADARPWNRLQARLCDLFAAVTTHPVGTVIDPPQRFLDRLENFRVSLLEFQLDVNFVVAAGLIRHVPLAAGVVFHRPLERLRSGTADQFAALAQ